MYQEHASCFTIVLWQLEVVSLLAHVRWEFILLYRTSLIQSGAKELPESGSQSVWRAF